MKTRYQLAFLVLLAGVLAICVIAGCEEKSGSRTTAGGTPAQKPVIVASIYPLASIASELVGDWAEVDTLLPPGESEHAFELPPEKLAKLAKADVLLTVGMKLDEAVEVKARNVGRKELQLIRMSVLLGLEEPPATWGVAPVSATAPATQHDDDHDDHHAHDDHDEHDYAHGHVHDYVHGNPHLWLDPGLTAKYAELLAQSLAPRFPGMAQPFTNRSRMLYANLLELDREYASRLRLVPNRKLVTFHNAFDLLAKRYDLEVVSHLTDIEVTPGGEITPARMKEVVDAVKMYKLHVLYTEPQLSDSAVKALSKEAGVRVMKLDPLGHPAVEGYRSYREMMKTNLATLAEGQTISR